MPKPVEDQVVVITGATSGVGRACVRAFGSRGAKVGLIGRGEEALTVAAGEVQQAGGEALMLPLDVSDSDAVEDAAAKVERQWGRIDTWVNDAMVTMLAPALEMSMEEFRQITNVNYLGSVYGTMAALKRMVPRDDGTVIQVCSALAYRSIPLQSAYCASKAAMRGFSDSVRTELLHDGSKVQVSVLILPAVNTPQFNHVKSLMPRHPQPVPPIYQPELIGRAAVYASEHRVREMTIGWGALKATLGQKLLPGLLDHYLAKVGYESQMTDQPVSSDQPNNLYAPVSGDPGCHGAFDARSRGGSVQYWLRTHPLLLAAAGAGTAALGSLTAKTGGGKLSQLAAVALTKVGPDASSDHLLNREGRTSGLLRRVWEDVRTELPK